LTVGIMFFCLQLLYEQLKLNLESSPFSHDRTDILFHMGILHFSKNLYIFYPYVIYFGRHKLINVSHEQIDTFSHSYKNLVRSMFCIVQSYVLEGLFLKLEDMKRFLIIDLMSYHIKWNNFLRFPWKWV